MYPEALYIIRIRHRYPEDRYQASHPHPAMAWLLYGCIRISSLNSTADEFLRNRSRTAHEGGRQTNFACRQSSIVIQKVSATLSRRRLPGNLPDARVRMLPAASSSSIRPGIGGPAVGHGRSLDVGEDFALHRTLARNGAVGPPGNPAEDVLLAHL